MKQMNLKKVLGSMVVLLLLLITGLSFYNNLGAKKSQPDLAGVILTPPPGYFLISLENGEKGLSLKEIADELDKILKQYSDKQKIGLKYRYSGKDSFVIVDLDKDIIQRLAANATGTVVETTWKKGVYERIRWCRLNGDFTPEGLAAPTTRNLYH